ncbi:amine oxidase flavin-containing [Vibrio astriarenae]|nr:amine oxidase flavin-containing [Vibrio sp. C7]
MTAGFKDKIRLSAPVTTVKRDNAGVIVESNGEKERYDQVIFACHSDQALALLDAPSVAEQAVLGDMSYQANEVVLHTDTALLPRERAAWASWNYHLSGDQGEAQRLPALTYNMNILQHIKAPHTFCVSLNSSDQIEPSKVLKTYTYHHPVFTVQSIAAQARKSDISGLNNTWYCGAYWHNGFHEDGVRSALDVVRALAQHSQPNLGAA